MKANLKQLEEIQKELFKQQCDLDIHKAMVKHFIKKEKAKQLTLNDVVSSASKCYTCDNCGRVRNDVGCIVCSSE